MTMEHTGDRRLTVCFVTLILSQYRVPFHRRVREILAERNIEYRLIYSAPTGENVAKADTADLDWATRIPVSTFTIAGQTLHWQSPGSHLRHSDLTIVSQENKLLLNYLLQARYVLFGEKLGFFGHGRSPLKGRLAPLARIVKRFLATRVHWWFAYTPEVADLVAGYGFPRERISINYNAIDTAALVSELDSITASEVRRFLDDQKIGSGKIGLYLGALYAEKRIDFLIEAAHRIRARVPDFELLVVGAGPAADLARKAAAENDFIHYAGPLFDRDKAIALKASEACLLPGAVGLAILDTFAAGCPLVTTTAPGHGPEVNYLKHGENGILVEDAGSVEAYSNAVTRMMTDEPYRNRLKAGARRSSGLFSIENMARHFSDGVVAALGDGNPDFDSCLSQRTGQPSQSLELTGNSAWRAEID